MGYTGCQCYSATEKDYTSLRYVRLRLRFARFKKYFDVVYDIFIDHRLLSYILFWAPDTGHWSRRPINCPKIELAISH